MIPEIIFALLFGSGVVYTVKVCKEENRVSAGPYRTACLECARLKMELANIKTSSGLHPYLDWSGRCFACTAPLLTEEVRGIYRKSHPKDNIFCNGKKTWWGKQKCPPLPHMHRYCNFCKAEWLTETATHEQT